MARWKGAQPCILALALQASWPFSGISNFCQGDAEHMYQCHEDSIDGYSDVSFFIFHLCVYSRDTHLIRVTSCGQMKRWKGGKVERWIGGRAECGHVERRKDGGRILET